MCVVHGLDWRNPPIDNHAVAEPEKQASSSDSPPDPLSAGERRNARYGLILFSLYLAFYGAFMALNLANPAAMPQPALGGANVAIVYGFALILAALVLALIYMVLCGKPVRGSDSRGDSQS